MHSRILQLPLRAPIQRLQIAARLPIRHASTVAPQTPSGRSRWTRRLIYASIFGALGVAAGGVLDSKISLPPQPGSSEDQIFMKEIQRVYERGLPIVQELRNNPDYEESGVYQGMPETSKVHRLTSSALAGSRGIALQVSRHGFQHTRLESCRGSRANLRKTTAEHLNYRTSGCHLLTYMVSDRESSQMTRRKRLLAWFTSDPVLKDGPPWSTVVLWEL